MKPLFEVVDDREDYNILVITRHGTAFTIHAAFNGINPSQRANAQALANSWNACGKPHGDY